MSIVYDYLKQIKDKKEPASDPTPASAEKPRRRAFPWRKIVLGIVVCSVVGVAVYIYVPHTINPIIKLAATPAADVVNIPMLRSQETSVVLEGIIYNPSQPFAIINGKMLEVRGAVGDFEVTKITPDAVTLRNTKDNTTQTLHL
jgi:hypothetical protein